MKLSHKLLSLLLLLCMLVPSGMLTALAEADDTDALRFGKQEATGTTVSATVTPAELLYLILGDRLGDAEADYLDRYCDRILEYYDRIPADRVSVRSSTSEARVTALAYEYSAENGAVVRWVPCEVVYNGREGVRMEKRGEEYEAVLAVRENEARELSVVYTCELSIPASVVNAIGGFVLNDAMQARDLPTSAEYASACAAYDAYLRAMDDYADQKADYEQYLRDRDEYVAEKEKYDTYLQKKAAYDEKYAVYETYQEALAAYTVAKAEYDRVYRENTAIMENYRRYLENVNRVRASMYAMESLFETPTSKKTRNLYGALQNQEIVKMFDRYRNELIRIYGVKEATLTHLKQTSDKLNAMLGEYEKARKISEEAAFVYYKANYHEISTLFNYLYDNMRAVMKGIIFSHMCAKIEEEYKNDPDMVSYKKWRLKNIVAHVYLICQVLDDNETADGTFSFYDDAGKAHTYFFSDLLDQNLILVDNNNSCPDAISWIAPVEPVEMPIPPVEPAVVEKPIAPAAVKEPTVPTPVSEPILPDAVPQPTFRTAAELALADRAVAIVAALKAGTLTPYTPVSGEQRVTLKKTLIRPISFGDGYLVTFYQVDGSIYEVKSEIIVGEPVPLPTANPTYTDAQYTYTFVGWATSPDHDPAAGLPALGVMPNDDLSLYAIYQKELRSYLVTVYQYEGDPAPSTYEYDYGTVPNLTPSRPESPWEVYTFTGWSPAVTSVTGDATYTGQWAVKERLYTISWIMPDGTTVERSAAYHTLPTPPTLSAVYYEGCVRYDFNGWGRAISPVTGDATYTAQYRRTVLAESEGEELTLASSLGEYHLTAPDRQTHVKELLAVAAEEEKRLSLTFPSISVSLDIESVRAWNQAGVAYVAPLRDTSGGVGVGCYDENGYALSPTGATMRLCLSYTATEGAIPCVLASDQNGTSFLSAASLEENGLVVEAQANRTYRTSQQYTLSVMGEGGALFADGTRYFAGDTPSITSYPFPDYELLSVTLTNDLTGESLTLSSLLGFTMPAYPATLSAIFVPKTYTVIFMSRGQIVSENTYRLGDTVKIPQIETDFEEDGYRYTFVGWSTPIGTVTGDATYTAKFFAVSLEEVSENALGEEWAMGTALLQIGLPAACIFVGLITTAVILIRRRRKKKKAKRDAQAEKAEKAETTQTEENAE